MCEVIERFLDVKVVSFISDENTPPPVVLVSLSFLKTLVFWENFSVFN